MPDCARHGAFCPQHSYCSLIDEKDARSGERGAAGRQRSKKRGKGQKTYREDVKHSDSSVAEHDDRGKERKS
eukprot:292574-Hanusia_phi.AAC.6